MPGTLYVLHVNQKKKKKAKILKWYNFQFTEEEAEATGDCVWKLRSTQMSRST